MLPASQRSSITGRIDELPSGGLASGHAAPAPGNAWPKVTSFPTHERARGMRSAGRLHRRILLLDADVAGGYRARVDAARHAPDATLLVCDPVVGFCGRAARALLRPQFSQGVLMQDRSRARPAHTAHRRGHVPAARRGRRSLFTTASSGAPRIPRAKASSSIPRGRSPWPACAMPTAPPAGADVFAGKWTLIYIGDGRCDDRLPHVARVRPAEPARAQQRDDARAARVPRDRQLLRHRLSRRANIRGSSRTTPRRPKPRRCSRSFRRTRANSLFIVDPLGNLMMRHDASQTTKGLLSDLKKLLKLSHIG